MSSFDTARDIRLPGVVVSEVYVDTTQLSTRMKNMIKEALRKGVAYGGWNSKSKQLARKIAEARRLPVIPSSSWSFQMPERHTYGDDTVREVLRLVDALEAVELMQTAEKYRGSAENIEYFASTIRTLMKDYRTIITTSYHHRWMRHLNHDISDQIIAEFTKTRSRDTLEAVERTCDDIDAGNRIAITLSI